MTPLTKTISFPNGTTISEPADAHIVAIIASPADPDLLRAELVAAARQTLQQAERIEAALQKPNIELVKGPISTDPEVPALGHALLNSTDVSVLVDQDGDPIALGPHLATDGPIFPKSGLTVLDALVSDARRRIADLHEKSAQLRAELGLTEGDRRLDWRIIRWMRTEADAAKFAAKLTTYADIGSTVSMVSATIVDGE